MRNLYNSLILIFILFFSVEAPAQQNYWHDQARKIHYKPSGESFKLVNGTRKFNRALYGTNTGFRVEAGDLPEFAMYMPGMGGNFQLGIISNKESKWITAADHVETTYIPGRVQYSITDKLLGEGQLQLQILALAEKEGFILKVVPENIPSEVSLIWVYGGASGKKFWRSGDIGADPESVFYLQPEYCKHNQYQIAKNSFELDYGWDSKSSTNKKEMIGVFPDSEVKLADVNKLSSPNSLWESKSKGLAVITGKIERLNEKLYWKIGPELDLVQNKLPDLKNDFNKAVFKADKLSDRILVKTPDPYLNTLGGALSTAADAIWEAPAYLHGSVAWRMHLNAWRGAYVADPLGWHDRAKSHFSSYGNSQVLEPEKGPVVPDSSRYFARQKEEIGTAMFSRGYISRRPNNNTIAHHYDMNLVFIDQLLKHFQWNGDMSFIKEMWPVIKRHLAWEKRNFDVDGDGLYDAYAAIWASDALQYSGGGVGYSSAYNYSANKMAAKLAALVGENPQKYKDEAEKIKKALFQELWIEEKGVFAEYKDLLGEQNLHEYPGIWSIYHLIDEGIPTKEQSLQMLHYVSSQIPHIPVKAEGLEENLEIISTTNWQPYTWSVNNVALAENLHMALAYWKGGNPTKAYDLWKSALIESMYLGASPGGFQQLSFYDAIRGELYRDFADPVGMAARSLVEGLFGIQPNVLENELSITPGFPIQWNEATLNIPDLQFEFKRNGNTSRFKIVQNFKKQLNLKLKLPISHERVDKVLVNGRAIEPRWVKDSYTLPKLIIELPYSKSYNIEVQQAGDAIEIIEPPSKIATTGQLNLNMTKSKILAVSDPQKIIESYDLKTNEFQLNDTEGNKGFFIKLQQGERLWWKMIKIELLPILEVIKHQISGNQVHLYLKNNSSNSFKGEINLNLFNGSNQQIQLPSNEEIEVLFSKEYAVSGTNQIRLHTQEKNYHLSFQDWDIKSANKSAFETIDLNSVFNSNVSDIFKNQYHSPRPLGPTLQLPTTGIGNWCYPWIADDIQIDDSGLRKKAGENQEILSPQGVPFKISSEDNKKNIAFVSQWDVYPNEIKVPLNGSASHAYLLMAGSTNPMQSQYVNGEVIIRYQDNSKEILELRNPDNWWPIEQDYINDGYAFVTNKPKPPRVYFKTGTITRDFKNYHTIKGYSDYGIDGGAGTILDMPLNPKKKLKSLSVRARANEVVIGLMGLSLKRN